MKCAGCMKTIKEPHLVRCMSTVCEKSFCTLCINVTTLTADRKKQWRCPDCCATQKKGGDNSLTPVRVTSDNVTVRKKTELTPESTESDVTKLTDQLRTMTEAFTALKAQLEDVTVSLSHSYERLDELVLKLGAADERLKYLEKREAEIVILRTTVTQLQSELNAQAQSNLRNEVEIVGIPETANENIQHIVLVAAKKIGIELEDRDVDWVSRVGPRRPPVTTSLPEDGARMPRPIVVRFLRRLTRDAFLRATKSRRRLSSSDLGVCSTQTERVFFNERLTKENRVLFRSARMRAKQLGYAFCWCSQGAIYVRRKEGRPAVQIRSPSDLERILALSVATEGTEREETISTVATSIP